MAFFERIAAAAVCLAVLAHDVRAGDLEMPPSATAANVLGARVAGEGYRIVDRVRSDGFLRIYTIATPYGSFEAAGTEMLETRLREIGALRMLESLDTSQEFARAAGQAATAPIQFAGQLISDPLNTLSDTVSGIGEMFDRITSGIGQESGGRDDLMSQLAGISRARREAAYRFGVDPYTDFAPLARRLDEIARASAFGGLTIKAIFALIPGTAGLAVTGVSTAESAQSLVRDKGPDELAVLNRHRLSALGLETGVIDRFLGNPVYTPGDRTRIVADLGRLKDVDGLAIVLLQISRAGTRELAFFQRRRIRLLADYHSGVRPLARFIAARSIPLNQTRDGRILALFPMDELSWCERAANAIDAITRDLRSKPGLAFVPAEFRVAGEVTAAARIELRQRGWTVSAGVEP